MPLRAALKQHAARGSRPRQILALALPGRQERYHVHHGTKCGLNVFQTGNDHASQGNSCPAVRVRFLIAFTRASQAISRASEHMELALLAT